MGFYFPSLYEKLFLMNSGVNVINKVLKRMVNKITYLFMTATERTFEQKAMEGKK